MARSLSSIRDDVRQIIGQTDSSNSNFSDAQLNIYINEGYRNVSTELEFATLTETAYTTANDVTLNSNTQSVDVVLFQVSDGTNTQWKELRVIDIFDLVKIDPDYENATAGEPEYAVKLGQFDMKMYPPLDANNISQASGLKTLGLSLPTELSSDSDETAFAHHLDDIISHWAAQRCFQRLNEAERVGSHMRMYRALLKGYRKTATRWSRGRSHFQWTRTDGAQSGRLDID